MGFNLGLKGLKHVQMWQIKFLDILLRLMEAHGEARFFTQCVLFAIDGICFKIATAFENL
jgi:hypothetical protein